MSVFGQNNETQLDLSTRQGFEHAYELHWKQMFNICYHYTQDSFQAEELVQEIFKSLWERRNQVDIQGSLENYLSRAARLKVSEYFRNKINREKHLALAAQELPQQGSYTEHTIEYTFLKDEINTLVDQLPSHCRQVYHMSRVDGLKNKEIASSLTISEKTVENQITKALTFLRKNLSIHK